MIKPEVLAAVALAAAIHASGCAAQTRTQTTAPDATVTGLPVGASDFTVRQFVLPQRFRIEGESSGGVRLQILMTEDRSWSAVVERGGRIWMATERGCPAFKAALESFGRLPPLYPGPERLRPEGRSGAIGPTTPHAEIWALRLGASAPDHSVVDMEISGSQDPYAHWASETVTVIIGCDQRVAE